MEMWKYSEIKAKELGSSEKNYLTTAQRLRTYYCYIRNSREGNVHWFGEYLPVMKFMYLFTSCPASIVTR
jgi:hypothetical protein